MRVFGAVGRGLGNMEKIPLGLIINGVCRVSHGRHIRFVVNWYILETLKMRERKIMDGRNDAEALMQEYDELRGVLEEIQNMH